MAEMIAKSLVGDTMGQVTGAFGGNEKKSKDDGEDEIADARKAEEDKRKVKHQKMEEERELVRQGIRDKYNLKKKDPAAEASNKYARKGTSPNQTSGSAEDKASENADETESAAGKKSSQETSKASNEGGKCSLQ